MSDAATATPAAVADDGMTFTMPAPKQRSNSKRKPSSDVLPLSFEDDLPL